MVEENDWRLQGQEQYLQGVELVKQDYCFYEANPNWDHDHCEFCWAEFQVGGPGESLSAGYSTRDQYRWICETCFNDFQPKFKWRVVQIERDV